MASHKALTFTFHDVVENDPDESGFLGPGPALYKVSWPQFEQHLRVLGETRGERRPFVVPDLGNARNGWALTFDDGGSSALEIGRALEARGWKGHFFVTVDRLGDAGFLTPEGIRELAAMGHAVGSHTCSHPHRMNACSEDELLDEWTRSISVLSGILETPVVVASIPGGGYHPRVARCAAASGIRYLFTSEPRLTTWAVGDCLLLGRFTVRRETSCDRVRAIARLSIGPRAQEFIVWNTRKAAKAVGGDTYLKARRLILARRG